LGILLVGVQWRFPPGFHQTSEPAEAVRRLSAEFESAQRSAFDMARQPKTEAERKAANQAMPDRRKYAQRFRVLEEKLRRLQDQE